MRSLKEACISSIGFVNSHQTELRPRNHPQTSEGENEMETITKAIETMGMIDILPHLVLDEPLPIAGLTRIRGIILMHKVSKISKAEWLHVAAADSAFDFLKAPDETTYTLADGRSFHDQREVTSQESGYQTSTPRKI